MVNIAFFCLFSQAKTSVKNVNVPVKKVDINMSATTQSELEQLRKKYTVKREVINRTTGENRTFYTIYNQVTVAGPVVYKSGQNLIGLVVFSIAVGLVTASLGDEGKPLLKFVDCINKVISKLVRYVMW